MIDIFDRKVKAGYGSHVIYSDDRGKTWRRKDHSDYSCLTVLPDKSIGIFYGRDRYSKITFGRFTLEWLTRGKDSVKLDR